MCIVRSKQHIICIQSSTLRDIRLLICWFNKCFRYGLQKQTHMQTAVSGIDSTCNLKLIVKEYMQAENKHLTKKKHRCEFSD